MARKTIKREKYIARRLVGVALLSASLLVPRISSSSEKRAWNLENARGKTVFRAVGRPSLLRVKGTAPAPKGRAFLEGNAISGVLTVELSEFDTGISLRNTHMRDKYLEVSKFPRAALELKNLMLPEKGEVVFDGILTLHGVSKAVRGKAQIERRTENGADLLRVEAMPSSRGSDV
ncbi:MAG: YceI family protein [Deltaproteobacteria bacterium]|nr:YceI family protein [Deltaproteobacteria bacterium]